jgi:hypothetical protein
MQVWLGIGRSEAIGSFATNTFASAGCLLFGAVPETVFSSLQVGTSLSPSPFGRYPGMLNSNLFDSFNRCSTRLAATLMLQEPSGRK